MAGLPGHHDVRRAVHAAQHARQRRGQGAVRGRWGGGGGGAAAGRGEGRGTQEGRTRGTARRGREGARGPSPVLLPRLPPTVRPTLRPRRRGPGPARMQWVHVHVHPASDPCGFMPMSMLTAQPKRGLLGQPHNSPSQRPWPLPCRLAAAVPAAPRTATTCRRPGLCESPPPLSLLLPPHPFLPYMLQACPSRSAGRPGTAARRCRPRWRRPSTLWWCWEVRRYR